MFGAALGARSGPVRRRSGVLRAKVIVVPPWDSPTALGGVPATTTSSSLLFSAVVSLVGRLPAALLLSLARFAAISAASAPVYALADALSLCQLVSKTFLARPLYQPISDRFSVPSRPQTLQAPASVIQQSIFGAGKVKLRYEE